MLLLNGLDTQSRTTNTYNNVISQELKEGDVVEMKLRDEKKQR